MGPLIAAAPVNTMVFGYDIGAAGLALVQIGVLLGALLSVAGYVVLLERKVIAWLQHRVGPNRAGPFGLLQPLADVLKLLTKEDFTPPFADRWLFIAAPGIIMVTSILSFAVIPFGADPRLVIADLSVGVLFFLALSSLGVYSIVLAGWSSNSKYAALGGLRATAQMISYELSMSLALLGVCVQAQTLSFNGIVEAQRGGMWFILLQPLGFVIFLVSVVAESRRAPFDMPEAENEIVAGFHTEYSSMKFAMFFLGEYVSVMLLSAVVATVYLGGYLGPNIPYVPVMLEGPFYLLLKLSALVIFFIWLRATYPRFRYDHLMELGWKYLIPLAVLNLVIAALLALLFPGLAVAPN